MKSWLSTRTWPLRGRTPGADSRVGRHLRRHWRGWIVVVAPAVAFAFSLSTLGDLALSNSPAGLTAFAPIGALMLAWGRLRVGPDERPEGRDLFFDSVTAAIPFGLALGLMIIVPTRMSLAYWLTRLDLLALPLFTTGVVILTWGFWSIRRIGWPLAYLFLLSPLPFIWFQQWFGDAFVSASVWGAGGLLNLTGLPIQVDPLDGRTIFSEAPGHEFSALVSQVCSGSNLTLGFLMVGGPVMHWFGGRLSRKVAWLAIGAGLALALNFVRVFGLAVALYALDEDVVFDVLHPLLGAGLFVGLFVAMLLAAGWFGLRFGRRPRREGDWLWEASSPQLGRRGLGMVAALAIAISVFDAGLADVAWVREDRLPAVTFEDPTTFAPDVPGWTATYDGRLLWGAYFGAGSRADGFIYRSEAIPEIDAQVVLARSLGQLNVRSLESCDLFHGHEIQGTRSIPLGHGVTGTVVRTVVDDGPVVTLYWTLPVLVDGDALYARMALFLDDELPVPAAPDSPVAANPITRATTALNSRLGDFAEPEPDTTLDRIDAHLTGLGRAIVAHLVAGATSAVADGAS